MIGSGVVEDPTEEVAVAVTTAGVAVVVATAGVTAVVVEAAEVMVGALSSAGGRSGAGSSDK